MIEQDKISEILHRQVATFTNRIAFELEGKQNRWFEGFGFPAFGVISNDYHEQVYFQSYLESYTRKMINGILYDILDEECASDQYKWPEFEFFGIYNGYTNSETEKEFGFEIIDLIDHIGYRYSFAHLDEIDELLNKGNVQKIKIVNWISDDDVVGYSYGDERIDAITSRDFFKELLFDWSTEAVEDFYNQFTKTVRKAVDTANAMISLKTVPGFTPAYLYQLRQEIIPELEKKISGYESFYVKNKNYKATQNNSKQLIQYYHIPEYFLKMKLQYAFIGKSPYAKSFLTSEYLFRYFENNSMFDYTPIVSGYIKSIEQLLHVLCENFNKINGGKDKLNGYTLGSYTKYIEEHDTVLRQEVRSAKDIIVACLDSYRIESRNHLFHRDYFNKWTRVKNIRDNTIFLYAVLLGSVDPSLLKYDNKILELLDDTYDKLFNIMAKVRDTHYFGIQFKDCVYDELELKRRDKGITYDMNGQIDTPIVFILRDTYEETTSEIKVSRDNIPTAIWKTDFAGNKVVLWTN